MGCEKFILQTGQHRFKTMEEVLPIREERWRSTQVRLHTLSLSALVQFGRMHQ